MINMSWRNLKKVALARVLKHLIQNLILATKICSKNDTDLEKISDLNTSHPARVYLEQRGIKDLDYFYYCPKFKEWTNKQKKTFDTLRQDSPRIIIPFKDKEGKLFGYQGRSLAPKAKLKIHYDHAGRRYNLRSLDRIELIMTNQLYIVEGPFDSTFIQNSVAMSWVRC